MVVLPVKTIMIAAAKAGLGLVLKGMKIVKKHAVEEVMGEAMDETENPLTDLFQKVKELLLRPGDLLQEHFMLAVVAVDPITLGFPEGQVEQVAAEPEALVFHQWHIGERELQILVGVLAVMDFMIIAMRQQVVLELY